MDYKLGIELREAGFKGAIDWIQTPFDDVIPNPTLNELIEACEDNDSVVSLDCERKSYYAEKRKHHELIASGEGSTHYEAMAKLWLALNKN